MGFREVNVTIKKTEGTVGHRVFSEKTLDFPCVSVFHVRRRKTAREEPRETDDEKKKKRQLIRFRSRLHKEPRVYFYTSLAKKNDKSYIKTRQVT